MDPSAIPQRIGSYQTIRLLQQSDRSVLFLGEHPYHKQQVVIKVAAPSLWQEEEAQGRLWREAEVMQRIHHPAIVSLYESGLWEGGIYLAMERVVGCNLKERIQKGHLPLEEALSIVFQAACALYHLHVHGVIHRDIKPQNLLLGSHGQVKLVDFGIVRFVFEKNVNVAAHKRLIGTPLYMSPEQKRNPENVGIFTDLYALGVVLYELVTGHIPKRPWQFSAVPLNLQKILLRSLHPNPEKRYPDALDFMEDLRSVLIEISGIS